MDFKDFLKLFQEWGKKYRSNDKFPELTMCSDCSGCIEINAGDKVFYFDNFDELITILKDEE